MTQPWVQDYNPAGSVALSTSVAAVPVCLLFYLLAVRRTAAWRAAVGAFLAAVVIALLVFHMPPALVAGALAHSVVFAAIRIILTLVGAVFIYDLTVASGHFSVIQDSIGSVSDDRRLQVLLIPLAFGALLEGSGGGGAPVAISAAMMIGLGFKAFEAASIALIANTVPVAWGALGNPLWTLAAVTGLPENDLSAMVGRILAWTALVLPLWLVRKRWTTRETAAVWPALAVAGLSFSGILLAWSRWMELPLVAVATGMGTLLVLALFFRVWRPVTVWRFPGDATGGAVRRPARAILRAWSPYLLLALFVIAWGMPPLKGLLDATTFKVPVPGLHLGVLRRPPVVIDAQPEAAIFELAWLSSVGTATLLAGLVAGPVLGLSVGATVRVFCRTIHRLRLSLLAIFAMLGLGFLTRYSGMDAVLGLALTHTGVLFPFFSPLIGWLGTALTGTNAASNALFGSLQAITARNLGLDPGLLAASNCAGGVMGKMINAQSLVVGCAATGLEGKEGDLFRAVFKHSLALAALVGLIVFAYAM